MKLVGCLLKTVLFLVLLPVVWHCRRSVSPSSPSSCGQDTS